MEKLNLEKYILDFTDWAVTFVPKLILAAIVLWIGFTIIKRLHNLVDSAISRTGISIEISTFLSSILDIVFKFIVILIAAGIIGFEITSLIGVLAAAGFAIGLALQGFLGNFASGLTIVFFKPYKVGDWVGVADKFGKVDNIQIFNTTLITPGDKTLIIPNGQITDNVITNFSTAGRIRLELNVTMPYEDSFPRIKSIILEALDKVDVVIQDPPPLVGIESFDSHSLVLSVRPYINPDKYWDATFKCYEVIKKAFNDNKVQVAYSEGIELGPIGS